MKGYKGYEKGLICRNKRYQEDTVFEEEKAKAFEAGMHFCEEPLEVWQYYPPGADLRLTTHEYTFVESLGEEDIHEGRSANRGALIPTHLVATTKLKIGKKIPLYDYIVNAIGRIREKARSESRHDLYGFNGTRAVATFSVDDFSDVKNTGSGSMAIAKGSNSLATIVKGENNEKSSIAICDGGVSVAVNEDKGSVALNNGNCGATINKGWNSLSASTGSASASVATGGYSISACTGDNSAAILQGDGIYSIAASSGLHGLAKLERGVNGGIAANSHPLSIAEVEGERDVALASGSDSVARVLGDSQRSIAIATGDKSTVSVEGEDNIAIATGYNSKIKGSLGSWLFCVERDYDGNILAAKTVQVDGENIKPDTYYTLHRGIFVEVYLT